MKKFIIVFFCLSLLPYKSVFAEYTAVDGDSIEYFGERIRLQGIDAPELYQKCWNSSGEEYFCGLEALHFLQDKIKNKKISCECEQKNDKYGRKLCECFAASENLNAEMVENGYAVSYKTEKYLSAEKSASSAKKGIWQGKFMRPAIYRALNRH